MSQDIRTQLADYFDYVSTQQGAVDVVDIVDPVAPVPAPLRRRSGNRGWLVVAVSALAVVLTVSVVAVLFSRDAGAPPATEPDTPTTTVDSAIAEEDEVTPTTAPDVQEPVGPVTFVGTSPPLVEGQIQITESFDGRLYAITTSGVLISTADGFEWVTEDVTIPPPAPGAASVLTTDGDRLAVLGVPESSPVGDDLCTRPGELSVHILEAGEWVSSTIPLPFETEPSPAGCYSVWGSSVQLSGDEAMVSLSVAGKVPFGYLIEQELGSEALESLAEVREVSQGLLVIWNDGDTESLIDFDELGVRDDIDAFVAEAQQVLGTAEEGTWVGESPFAWWSDDASTWTPLSDEAPSMSDHQVWTVGTPDGFVMRSDAGSTDLVRSGVVVGTASLPEGRIERWQGRPVVVLPSNEFGGSSQGVVALDTGEVLIPASAVEGYRLIFGESVVLGIDADDVRDDFDPSARITFSRNGETFDEWDTTELGLPEAERGRRVIAVTDEFILALDYTTGVLWVGTLTP